MRPTITEKGKKAKKRIWIESTMVFFIILAPFLLKVYEFFPTDPKASITWFGQELGKNNWPSYQVHVWFMFQKIVPLYLIFIWFMTSRNWWYHILLLPMVMYAFQIFEDVFDSDGVVDTDNLLWLLPICIVLIPFVYYIRLKLYDKHVYGIDLEAMDAEIKDLKNKRLYKKDNSAHRVQNADKSDALAEDFNNATPEMPSSVSR